ncbi:MAG: tRNA (N6-isopentenyl adenosine(37)-C2)-methylthiotransferase MiaB [Bacteroidales bacterium]|nr:tRNA (N6-isopentenyl adenosine(37)-C2)-methylthiotransferase MiaB [Bacteroidales bacterium]
MNKGKLYIETYGCQMNFSDSEIVASVLAEDYDIVEQAGDADLILINTCSIRDNAEQRVFKRLSELNVHRKNNKQLQIGIIGCMAERLKEELFNKGKVDIIVGPDAYRDLPTMLKKDSQTNINTLLSEIETYDDISPVRYDTNGISAFVSIMRGCNNFCSYCVVPYTRGRERSRNPQTIIDEISRLFDDGYREVTLLGQNVNSYCFEEIDFSSLIASVASINPLLRVRFATSHPKDLSDKLIKTMSNYPNICKSIHLPVQSGNNDVLKRMNRQYTRQKYLNSVENIRKYMPECTISTDLITGFCNETEDEHKDTLSLMQTVGFDYAYMFQYSMREGTAAHKNMCDNVSNDIKARRLEEIIRLQQELSAISNKKDIGKTYEVLIEGISKRSQNHLSGRNSQNKVIIFPKENNKKGEYVQVKILSCTSATLLGSIIEN